jgi:hypothetical protein
MHYSPKNYGITIMPSESMPCSTVLRLLTVSGLTITAPRIPLPGAADSGSFFILSPIFRHEWEVIHLGFVRRIQDVGACEEGYKIRDPSTTANDVSRCGCTRLALMMC